MVLWKNTWKKQLVCQTLCFSLLVQTGVAAAGGVPTPQAPREWVDGSRLAAVSALAPAPSMTSAAPSQEPRATSQSPAAPKPEPAPEPKPEPKPEKITFPPSVLTDSAGRHEAAPSQPTAQPAPDGLPPFPPGMDGAALSRSLAASSAQASPIAGTAGTAGLTASSLAAGWNLSSVPNEPVDRSPAAVFSSIAGKFARVFAYDACTPGDPWKLYDPANAAASDLTAIDQKHGFWIEMTAPAAVPDPGFPASQTTIHLCPGWNLIGFPAEQARPVRTALASIEGKYTRVFGFDPTDPSDPWELYDAATPAWANDLVLMQPGRGYWVFATAETDLTIFHDAAEPDLAITAPASLAVVTAPTEVRGIVTGDLLQSWTLSYRAHGEDEATVFASGTTAVVNGPLGTFDPTLLLNGGYAIELTATDLNGESTTIAIDVSVEGQMKIGNFTLSFLDLEIPLSGLPIQVIRHYDSRDKRRGDFGVGWTLEMKQGSYRNNRKPGQGWQISSGFLPCQNIGETAPHITTIRLSDREVYRFRLRLASPAITLGGCFAQARFDFVDGPIPGSTLTILGNTEVLYQNGTSYVIDSDSLDMYEPKQVRMTTRDGRVFDLDLQQGVTRLQDLNGNVLSITPAAVTHSSGLSVAFQRDGLGRITSITDPEGESVTYEYDAAGDLVAVTDRESNTTRFTYAVNHHLLEIEDPLGRKPVRNEYDASGRLIRTTDAFGKSIELDHRLGDRREIVTDRLGHTRLLEYDNRGNVVREVDANGKETQRTFDAKDHLLTETDPLGKTTAYTYDAAGNTTSITDAAGNRTAYTYNSRGQALTILDPRGKLTASSYDASGNLTETADPLGRITLYTYDVRGNLLSVTDPEGNATAFIVDSSGNRSREIDALGNTRSYTYDQSGRRRTQAVTRTTPAGAEILQWTYSYNREGRLILTQEPDGTSSSTTFDALGNVTATIDNLGRRTGYNYDLMGRLTVKTYPDGTAEQTAYDVEGRRISTTDRAGRTTQFEHDALGRLVKTVYPDGAFTSNTYNDSGRLSAARDARGNTTQYESDGAGRLLRLADALGHETRFTYDGNENRTSITDANGQTTRFEYDDVNRLVRTVFPDGTEFRLAYDQADRKIQETDQAGKATRFSYDDLGRLTEVTDALGQVTRYTYDELGNRTSQTDANGHATSFEYDVRGRLVKRILPLGHSETRNYDAVGNLTRRVDFNGAVVTHSYDVNDRLISRSYPNGSSVGFTYTPIGRRATATDSRGTTVYEYDSRDRLVSLTDPRGRELSYGYDHQGNRTSMTAALGSVQLPTSYSYDARNRLETVSDSAGRLYSHAYDANGNRISLTYPNGVATTYTYNALNRLLNLTSRGVGGISIQSHSYTLGPVGNRLSVDEMDGTRRAYEYDDLYRLTGETVTQNAGVLSEEDFTYDPVGNRLTRSRTSGTITYAYDERDRLLSEGGVSHTWDANGNLTAKSGADGATYVWDLDNRLIRVDRSDGTVIHHAYDADGNRVRTEVVPSAGSPVVTEYLIDPVHSLSSVGSPHELSQVVAELDAAGNVTASYVRGDDLLAIIRPGGTRFYHADGLGSIRALTDETGAVTDRYSFSVFGELAAHSGSDPNAYLFAGEALDPNSGFYYLRARWMDPAIGRFASTDPLLGNPFDPRTLHRYTYAHDDPANTIDPSGQEGYLSVAFSLAIQGVIGAIISGGITYLTTRNVKKSLASALGGFILGVFIGGVFQAVRGLLAVRSAATAAAAVGAADDVLITADKLRYLLKLDPGKAKGFAELGYTLENADDLANVFRYSRTLITETTPKIAAEYGTKYQMALKVIGANGREGLIEVVWQVDHGATIFRLITAIAKPF